MVGRTQTSAEEAVFATPEFAVFWTRISSKLPSEGVRPFAICRICNPPFRRRDPFSQRVPRRSDLGSDRSAVHPLLRIEIELVGWKWRGFSKLLAIDRILPAPPFAGC